MDYNEMRLNIIINGKQLTEAEFWRATDWSLSKIDKQWVERRTLHIHPKLPKSFKYTTR